MRQCQQELLQLACHQWASTPPIPAGAKRILYTKGNTSRKKGWWRTGTDKLAFHSLNTEVAAIPRRTISRTDMLDLEEFLHTSLKKTCQTCARM